MRSMEAGLVLTAPWIEHRYTPETLVGAVWEVAGPGGRGVEAYGDLGVKLGNGRIVLSSDLEH